MVLYFFLDCLHLLVHCLLLVVKVPDAVVVVLELPLKRTLAPATIDQFLLTLGLDMDFDVFFEKLLFAVRASHFSFVTVHEMGPQLIL